MINAGQFIDLCQQVIADHASGKLSLHDAAAKINASPTDYPFSGPAHPMVYKVADLAFDIAEDYRDQAADNADWESLTRTLDNYVTGSWEPTCIILSATYGEFEDGRMVRSYSLAVRRQNGENTIEAAVDEIKDTVAALAQKVNAQQTDERYLQNLALFIPEQIGAYKRANLGVGEYLTEPYYTTAG